MKINFAIVIYSAISLHGKLLATASTSIATLKTSEIPYSTSNTSFTYEVKASTSASLSTATSTSAPSYEPVNYLTPVCTNEIKRRCILDECPVGFIVSKNTKLAIGGCCPKCVKQLSLDEPCTPNDDTSGMCGQGLKCSEQDKKCKIQSCLGWKCPLIAYGYDSSFCVNPAPTCDTDGTFSAKQCKGQKFSGRCFCYNAEGTRIFGQEWMKQAENITCGCARKVDSLRKERDLSGDVTIHCTSTGDWESLQCDSGVCWCADEQTGKPLSRVVPQTMKISLPCYTSDDPIYLRQCESALYAGAQITKIMKMRGTSFGFSSILFCDPDGSYGSYQVNENYGVFCSGQDKSQLGPWQTTLDNIPNLDCNCARDAKVIYENAHLSFTQQCSGTGNYKKLQIAGFEGESNQYCCDNDGFPLTKPIPSTEKLNCGENF